MNHHSGKKRGSADHARQGHDARVLRIIGGTWRGRKLRFPPSPEIRPTPDRVRETLFNWLAPRLPGARCLDLFAGSGALGLESLSRGAAHVTFVERDAAAARELRARLVEWGATGGHVEQSDALRFLAQSVPEPRAMPRPATEAAPAPEQMPPGGLASATGLGPTTSGASAGVWRPFDIVFLDPPFGSNLLNEVPARLEQGHWLSPGALIYIECAARSGLPALPEGWTVTKAKEAGEVGYHLLTRAHQGA